ncbi:MAG: glycosyltransferase family 2 protein [Rhodothermaceae bacterium]
MIKLSSIIIAKNEEANIARCIESQLECIDEIIVIIDSKTTDRTEEIVSSYPDVKYEVVEWMGFSKTKQYAVEKASNDWIFWIDADEAVRPELIDEIKQLKTSEPAYPVYSVARRAYFLDKWIKHSGWYPGRVERLFNKHKAVFSDSDVHEHLVYEGPAGKLKNDLDHFTDPNIFHYFEKFNKYTSLAAVQLQKRDKKVKLSDIVIRPVYMFIKMYFIRRGILDGTHGLILAMLSSAYVFTKYSKLWELQVKGKE